jgi:hypothetical protein
LDGCRDFDRFGFGRLAQQQPQKKKQVERQQGLLASEPSRLVDTGARSMRKSHGRYACPGRSFDAVELKLVLVHGLLHYDILMPDGADGRPMPHPRNVEKDSNWLPFPAELLLHAVDKPLRFANRHCHSRSRALPNGACATRSCPSFTEVTGPISKPRSLFRNFGPKLVSDCIGVLLLLH